MGVLTKGVIHLGINSSSIFWLEDGRMLRFVKMVSVMVTMTFSYYAHAATVSCTFMSETQITKDGEWLKTETDFMKLMEIFGDGLELSLENSLLVKLDMQEPFIAGQTERGTVYLMGGDMGIEGKNISVQGNVITIYDGMCDVSFG